MNLHNRHGYLIGQMGNTDETPPILMCWPT